MTNSPPREESHEDDDKSHSTNPDLSASNSDPRNEPDSAVDDEEDDGEEGPELESRTVSLAMSIIPQHPIGHTLVSPSGQRASRKTTAGKRKRGKGKGLANFKKQQVIKEKLQSLTGGLNAIPFKPNKILDFVKHEKLLKKLGLWDFVHIDFDRNIRVDLISQLVATYEPKIRASYVNDFRIMVNRADLARAFRLSLKKEKGNVGLVEVDLDPEVLSDDSVGFMGALFSEWFLLHEDTWIMPNEVNEWMKLINDGHPEKVDWAGLFWFMVEKELKQGAHLKNCYYASHLQHLIKVQRSELLLTGGPVAETLELDSETKEEKEEDQVDCGDTKAGDAVGILEEEEEGHGVTGPSTELTLGQDGNEDIKDSEILDAETGKDSHEDGGEGEEGEENGQWLSEGRSNMGGNFLQPCSTGNGVNLASIDYVEEEVDGMDDEEVEGEEDEEDEEMQKFHAFASENALQDVGFTGNFLQEMGASQTVPNSQDHLHIGADMQHHLPPNPSFYSSSGKRPIEDRLPHHSINEASKRLKMHDSFNDQDMDFGMLMESIAQTCGRAKMLYDEKDETVEHLNMNQEIMMAEVQKRDSVIEHLHKMRQEEQQKIYRLERELYLMSSVLDGYRKALRETEKLFAEYRARTQLPEEPTYKDAGPGGLMLTGAEIERLRKQEEEGFGNNCLIIEQKMNDAEQEYIASFTSGCFEKLHLLDKRLTDVEESFKDLLQVHGRIKGEKELPVADLPESHVAELESTPEIAGGQVAEPEKAPATEKELQVDAAHEPTPQNTEEVQVGDCPPDE